MSADERSGDSPDPLEDNMSARTSMLDLVAIATIAMSALAPSGAFAFGQGSRAAAPAHVLISTHVSSYRYGWGYGRGWCYWHPYACYYR
jgi:hypothetical protein